MSLDTRITEAVQHFWLTRGVQAQEQAERGITDQGARSQVTGGKQMDGFVKITSDILHECGLSDSEVFFNSYLELPGYYRPEKRWDVLAVADGSLIAAIEFKAQIGPSFGNNFNNRTEEAIGNAIDLWTAYREGAIPTTPRPWLGYLMLLEDCDASTRPVSVREPHFEVFPEFKGASYAERYRILLTKLMRERLYEATCLIMSSKDDVDTGAYTEPDEDLVFRHFEESLRAHATAFSQIRSKG